NVIIKKLPMLCIIRSSVSLSTLSVSFSTALSQSSTSISVSDSPASTTSVSAILTSASTTSTLSVSVTSIFIISSLSFKKILHRLDELYFSIYTLLLFLSISRIIYYTKT
ncbi:hypothetical protein BDDG_12817, partial [Blastomyces dermatitidis ATCC 18188]